MTPKGGPLLLLAALLFIPTSAFGADPLPCALFFQQDVHDSLTVLDETTGHTVDASNLCGKHGDDQSGSFGVSYAGVALNASDQQKITDEYCNKTLSEKLVNHFGEVSQTLVDANAINAALECERLYAGGLVYTVAPQAELGSTRISMSYDSHGNSVKLKGIEWEPKADAECHFLDPKDTAPFDLSGASHTLSCTRNATAPDGPIAITIDTDAGPIDAVIPRKAPAPVVFVHDHPPKNGNWVGEYYSSSDDFKAKIVAFLDAAGPRPDGIYGSLAVGDSLDNFYVFVREDHDPQYKYAVIPGSIQQKPLSDAWPQSFADLVAGGAIPIGLNNSAAPNDVLWYIQVTKKVAGL